MARARALRDLALARKTAELEWDERRLLDVANMTTNEMTSLHVAFTSNLNSTLNSARAWTRKKGTRVGFDVTGNKFGRVSKPLAELTTILADRLVPTTKRCASPDVEDAAMAYRNALRGDPFPLGRSFPSEPDQAWIDRFDKARTNALVTEIELKKVVEAKIAAIRESITELKFDEDLT